MSKMTPALCARYTASGGAAKRLFTTLIQKWLVGPDGWTTPICISAARPNGKIHYAWTNGKGAGFHLTGDYLELEPYGRIVHVERMHLPDPTSDNHVETRFDPDGAGTLMTMRMTLPDSETRARMLATGWSMEWKRATFGSKVCSRPFVPSRIHHRADHVANFLTEPL